MFDGVQYEPEQLVVQAQIKEISNKGIKMYPLSVSAPCHSCPFLVKHLTGCIPVIGGALFVFVVITLLQTSFSDPGILPRATPDEAADIEKQIGKGQKNNYTY